MKKQLVVAGMVATTGLAGLTGVSIVNAETNSTNQNNQMSSLVDALASKFNLNKTDVQKVVDEQHAKMQSEREQRGKDQVAKLVTDGKLTQAQADKISAKRAAMQKEREANRTTMQAMTADEQKAEMASHRTELNQWMEDNGIDSQYGYLLMGGPARGHGGGMMRGGEGLGRGAEATSVESAT